MNLKAAFIAAFLLGALPGIRGVAYGQTSAEPERVKRVAVQPRQAYQLRHSDPVEALAFSPDGKLLATGGRNKLVHLWSVEAGKIEKTFAGHLSPVHAIAFSPDASLLASGGDGDILIWEVATGKVLASFLAHEPGVDTLAFSPDGKLLVSSGWDAVVSLWNVEAARQGRKAGRNLIGHKTRVTTVAFAPNGKHLVSGGWDNTVRIWNAESGALLHTLKGHTDWVQCIAFSSDGKLLASAGWDNTVRVWEFAGLLQGRTQEKYALSGHSAVISAIQFLPMPAGTEPLLVSSSWDKKVLLWDVPAKRVKETLATGRDWVQSLAVAADGHSLASGGFDGVVRLWRM